MERPGGVLGVSWGLLGADLGVLGRLGSVLRAFWDVLGASWNVLLILLGNPPQKLSILPSKMDPPNIKNHENSLVFIVFLSFSQFLRSDRFVRRFWCQLGSILEGFWASWGGLGASWVLLGPSWGRLGASWGVLGRPGASWRRLGAVLALKNLST